MHQMKKDCSKFSSSSNRCLYHTMYLNATCKGGCRCQHIRDIALTKEGNRISAFVEIHAIRRGRAILDKGVESSKQYRLGKIKTIRETRRQAHTVQTNKRPNEGNSTNICAKLNPFPRSFLRIH